MENIRGITTSFENDFFYRYKMSKVVLVQEKTKNRLTNLRQISDEIKTPHDIFIKFLNYFIGMKLKEDGTSYIISNNISIDVIRNAIYTYIEYFVLCYHCKLPEVKIKRRKCTLHCDACGKVSEILISSHTQKILEYLSR
jgi:translation initiation factor 2 beta subunit (eIF-2beta)/eIF-5